MKRFVATVIILLFDILFVTMFALAIGFVRYYHFDFGYVDLGIATVLYVAFRIYHSKKVKATGKPPIKPLHVLLIWLFLFLLIAAPTTLVWVKKTFPVQNPDLTIMTLQMPVDGFVFIFVQDFFSRVGFYALALSLALLWPVYDLYHSIRFRRTLFAIAFIAILISGSAPFWKAISPQARRQYIDYITHKQDKLYHSKFYNGHFVKYSPDMVSADDTTRNLIFIYVESLENSFLSHAPEIRKLYDNGLVFADQENTYGGGRNIIGAATTISSMVSKTTGLPLLCGSSFMNNFGESGLTFFENVPGIYDILHQYGYRNIYVQGTPERFGATGPFFASHGVDDIYDKNDVEKMLIEKGDKYRRSGPGLADADVFEYAKRVLDTLSDDKFSLTLTTIDTHYPRGFLDKRCRERPKSSADKDYFAAVLRCTSKRLGAFVDWVENQPFGKNTEVVIAGDHLFMARSPVSKMRLRDRRFLNIYINPKYSTDQTKRTYTSFDSAPTLLETMGFHIEGHRLGFGASLLSDERTLLETFGERKLVRMLRELSGSIEYNELFKNKAP